MERLISFIVLILLASYAAASGVNIYQKDLNVYDGNIIVEGGGILGATNLLDVYSNTIVHGNLDAVGITADSGSAGSVTVSNSLIVSGTSVLHNVIPGSGEWNIGTGNERWSWIFARGIDANNQICLAGSCITSWDDVNKGGVVGNGTPNYVVKWGNSGTELNTSQIYDNGTNVGIGTASPSYKLDVNGNVNIANGAIVKGYSGTTPWWGWTKAIDISSASGPQYRTITYTNPPNSKGWMLAFHGSNDYFAIAHTSNAWSTGSIYVYVSGTGAVGIGTTSPGAKLDVAGTVNANGYSVGGTTIIDSSRNVNNVNSIKTNSIYVPPSSYVTIYVSPDGTGDCTSSNPCSLDYALTNKLPEAVEIILNPGTYTISNNYVIRNRWIYFKGNGTSPEDVNVFFQTYVSGSYNKAYSIMFDNSRVILSNLLLSQAGKANSSYGWAIGGGDGVPIVLGNGSGEGFSELYLDSVAIVQREPWFISAKHNFADISFNGKMEINAMDDAQVLIITDFGYATIHYWNNGFSLNVPAGYKIISGYGLWNFTGSFPSAYLPNYYIPTALGIGTTSPAYTLDVSGNIHASGDIISSSALRTPILYDEDNSSYKLDPDSFSKLNELNVNTLNGSTPITTSNIGQHAVTQVAVGTGLNGGGGPGSITVSLDTSYTDARYVNASGDTMTGNLTIQGTNPYLVLYDTDTSAAFKRKYILGYDDRVGFDYYDGTNWREYFKFYSSGLAWIYGDVQAERFVDRDNTGYYIDPASTSKVSEINATGSVVTNRITDSAGNPRIEFNTDSGSVIVYVG